MQWEEEGNPKSVVERKKSSVDVRYWSGMRGESDIERERCFYHKMLLACGKLKQLFL